MPITSLNIDFSTVEDSNMPADSKPVHTKFLKKYDRKEPVKARKRAPKPIPFDTQSEEEEKRERSPRSGRSLSRRAGEQEERRQEDDRPPRHFLKRRSRAVQSQRLMWDVPSRVDCWGHRKARQSASAKRQPSPPRKVSRRRQRLSPSASPRVKPFGLSAFDLSPRRKSKLTECKPVDQLEKLFAGMERLHVFVSAYFSRPDIETRIPQFRPDSYFVTHYTEDIYPETLETLETHYNYLCSEADE